MRIAADLSGSCGLPGVSGILPRTGETCRTFWSYAHRQAEVRQLLQGEMYSFFKYKKYNFEFIYYLFCVLKLVWSSEFCLVLDA